MMIPNNELPRWRVRTAEKDPLKPAKQKQTKQILKINELN